MRIGKDPLSIAQSRFVKENIQEADVLSVNNETHSAVVRLRNNNQTMRISLGSVDPIYVKDDRARVLVYTSPFGGATAISFIGTKPTVASSPGVTLGDAHGGTQWCIYNSNGLPIFCVDSSGTQLVTYGVYVAYSYDVPDAENADTVDYYHASDVATANTILALDDNAEFPASVYPDALLTDGTRALTGNLSVDPGITIDGVDISGHAARHLPSGADPITTGTPSTIQVQANDAGSAESLAKSDHLHNVSTGTPDADSVGVSASDPGTNSSLARSDHYHNIDEGMAPTWTGEHTFQSDIQLDANLDFVGAQSITTSSGDLTIAPTNDLKLNPGNGLVRLDDADTFRSDTYASQTTGFAITGAGDADFRYLFTDELHAKSFIADLEQALAGGQIITKSVTTVAQDFTLNTVYAIVGVDTTSDYFSISGNHTTEFASGWFKVKGSTGNDGNWQISSASYDSGNDETDIYTVQDITDATVDGSLVKSQTIWFNDLPSAEGMAVFETGDWIAFRQFSRASGSLTISWAWGTVTGYTDQSDAQQTWIFWRDPETPGTATGSISAESVVLDFGTSGMGFHEVNAIDGLYGVNSPYAQVVTWTTHPSTQTVRTRIGNLYGVTATSNEYGMFAGEGTASADARIVASNTGVDLHNMDLTIYSGGNNVFLVNSSTPYLSLGSTAPTVFGGSDTGVWMGNDGGIYKWRVGNPSGVRVQWDGSELNLYNSSNAETISFDASGNADITGKLRMPGTSSAIAIGSTPPTDYNAGTGIWIDRTGLYSLDTDVYQVKIDATDGVLYAGGGDVILDSNGISLMAGTADTEYVKWYNGTEKIAHLESYNLASTNWLVVSANSTTSGPYQTINIQTYDSSIRLHGGVTPPHADVYGEMRFLNGIYVGNLTTAATDDDIRADGDICAGSGIYAGNSGADPGLGRIVATDYIVGQGGIRAGSISDPGAGNISASGTISAGSSITSTGGSVYAAGGIYAGATSGATSDDIRADGSISCGAGLYVGDASSASTEGRVFVYHDDGVADVTIQGVGDGTHYSYLDLRSDEATDKRWYLAHKVSQNQLDLRNHDGTQTNYTMCFGLTDDTVSINHTAAGVAQLFVNQSDNAGDLPALRLDQDDVDRDFISFVGTAASTDLNRSLVDDGDVSTEGAGGYLKIYIQDDGNQIADGYYYIPFVTIS